MAVLHIPLRCRRFRELVETLAALIRWLGHFVLKCVTSEVLRSWFKEISFGAFDCPVFLEMGRRPSNSGSGMTDGMVESRDMDIGTTKATCDVDGKAAHEDFLRKKAAAKKTAFLGDALPIALVLFT